MKTRNKVIIGISTILLIMIIAGYGLVSACGPWGNPYRGFKSGFHGRGFNSSFNNKDIADFILWQMDKKAEDLSLSGIQLAKYNEIKENLRSRFSKRGNDHQRLIEEFHREMNKEDPDFRLLINSLKEKIDEISGFAEENLTLLVEFYESLDKNQQRMIIDEIKERMEYCRSRF